MALFLLARLLFLDKSPATLGHVIPSIILALEVWQRVFSYAHGDKVTRTKPRVFERRLGSYDS